jgi:peptide/nickel transport system permease protein
VPHALRRGLESLILFWLVVTLTFVLTHLAPGDATTLLLPPTARAEDAAQLRAALGLDASLGEQYVRWIGRLLRGELGLSFATGEPVRDVVGRALPVSLLLGGSSLLLTFVIGVAVGFWQAARRGTWPDQLTTAVSLAIFSAPSFWLALSLVAVFTYVASLAGWPAWMRLPAMGSTAPGSDLSGFAHLVDLTRHAVLPVTVLTCIGAAGLARYARATAISLQQAGWARTARAKGTTDRQVLFGHVLANARAPLIVLFALALPGTIAGSVFVESVFAWPGMGRVMLGGIAARDYPVVMAATVWYAGLVILSNWAADVAVVWSDPRRRA